MKKITKTLIFASVLTFSINAFSANTTGNLLITAKLNGAQEVPVVNTSAVGIASFTFNKTRDTICINAAFNGLSGPITGVHLHAGEAGATGGVVVDLVPYLTGNRIVAQITSTAIITPAFISKFLSGGLYINVHTSASPDGEIRGQLLLESDYSYVASLDSLQEVPATNTKAYGLGVFNLSQNKKSLEFHVVASGLTGAITAAHLHAGAKGANGGVVVDLTTFIKGGTIQGQIDTAAITNASIFLNNLKAGNIYVNVHTGSNPNGEIRGQLWIDKKLAFDADLTVDQEVPLTTIDASGVASIKLNATLDTLWYDIVATNLTGAINSAHFHNGIAGTNGGVVIDLGANIKGNRIKGWVAGVSLTPAFVNNLFNGSVYVNLHTTASPNGEIRGQVYSLKREGFVSQLNGAQEVPPVITAAYGAAIVSIDRHFTNAHYMYVAAGFSGTPNGAHFHIGVAGKAGDVLYHLTTASVFSGTTASAFGYLNNTDPAPFTSANAKRILSDSVYINIHTPANSGGEIRGQIRKGAICFNGTSSVDENAKSVDGVSAYPNPVTGILTLKLESSVNEPSAIFVYDVLGKQVVEQSVGITKGINEYKIDLSGIAKGIYFVKISNNAQLSIQKIIKE